MVSMNVLIAQDYVFLQEDVKYTLELRVVYPFLVYRHKF